MRVYVVLELIEHDEYDFIADNVKIVGVYNDKLDAIKCVNARFDDELEGRGLDKGDGWTDHNGGNIRDEEDKCEISWSIEPHEVW